MVLDSLKKDLLTTVSIFSPFKSDSQQAESKEIKTGSKSLSNEQTSDYKQMTAQELSAKLAVPICSFYGL